MQFYSDDKQDIFVANLLKFKRDGYYLDIGSSSSVGSNNSFFFESLDWKGICIEKNPMFNSSYESRTCIYINEDALKVDYEKVFEENEMPLVIDYLSLDVDEASTEVLKILPLYKYKFKVITCEHDSHFFGDKYKKRQRKILLSKGYFLLGEDMLNQSGRNIGQQHAWEDFWVHPDFFEKDFLEKIYSCRVFTDEIINKIKST